MKALTSWGGVSAASFAAAAVLLSGSPASAEERAAEFETEFELDAAPAIEVQQAAATEAIATVAAAENKPCLDGQCLLSVASSWETAIGEYLDGLLERAKRVDADVLVEATAGSEPDVLTVEELSAAAPGFEPAPVVEEPSVAGIEVEPAAVEAASDIAAEPAPPCDLNKLAEAGGWRILARWSSERAEAVVRALQDHVPK